jgi:hypothetical protein
MAPPSQDLATIGAFMKQAVALIVCASSLVGSAVAQAPASPALPAFLSGCWEAIGGEAGSGETWLPPAGGTMFGVSRTVKNGRTVAYEFMQIRAGTDGSTVFVARPSGQPEATFVLAAQGAGEVVFENPQHDFPQRVIYRLHRAGDEQRLLGRIEGLRQGVARAIDFPYRRVPCGAPRP